MNEIVVNGKKAHFNQHLHLWQLSFTDWIPANVLDLKKTMFRKTKYWQTDVGFYRTLVCYTFENLPYQQKNKKNQTIPEERTQSFEIKITFLKSNLQVNSRWSGHSDVPHRVVRRFCSSRMLFKAVSSSRDRSTESNWLASSWTLSPFPTGTLMTISSLPAAMGEPLTEML